MKFTRLGAFTLGVVITAVSVGAVSFVNAAGNGTLKACANKTTGVMRYISKGSCKKTETSLSWNQMGPTGLSGSAGTKGDTGAAGTKGDTGSKGDTGTKGDTGDTGAKGDPGAAGTKGDTGNAGAKGDTGAAGSSFYARSVCGADGTTLCAVGVQGPGGGTVFFVDTEGRYSDFDYLEVAPADAPTAPSGVAWSSITPQCGIAIPLASCRTTFLSTSGEALNFLAIGTGRAATAAIVTRHNAGNISENTYAAGAADEYTTATASDWYLPSKDELNEVCKYARNTGQAAGASIMCSGGTLRVGFTSGSYWSSSEYNASQAWGQYFPFGLMGNDEKAASSSFVRPVRAF